MKVIFIYLNGIHIERCPGTAAADRAGRFPQESSHSVINCQSMRTAVAVLGFSLTLSAPAVAQSESDKKRSAQVNGSLVYRGATAATPNEGYAKATSFWLADRIRIGDLPLLRHERVSSRADVAVPTSASNTLEKTTLGLGVNYEVGSQWTVLAGVHQGFAPPGSGAVEGSRGEESTNLEGGLRFRNARFGFDAVGFYTGYDNALRNCLVADPCANGAIDGVQQDGAKEVYGVEVGLSGNLADRNGLRFPVRLAYTYTDGKYTRGADVTSGVREGDVLDYTSKHIGRLIVARGNPGRYVGTGLRVHF